MKPEDAFVMRQSTSLYRHFAEDGVLLYVGISLSWPTRTKAHARGSAWFNDVARVEIGRFDSREDALIAERDAIIRELPKFNVVHNRSATSKAEKRPQEKKHQQRFVDWIDPLFEVVKGPDAIVGPALVYRDDKISMMVAHGEPGSEGELTEVVLGGLAPEAPEWANAAASVIMICRAGDLTMAQAADARRGIIRKLSLHLRSVEVFDTDLALAVAYASRFPSEKSREVLDQVAVERRVYA